MGTTAHIVVVDGPPAALADAAEHVADLERRWSRFLPGSEVSRLNLAAGRPVTVSAPTFDLVERAVDAWQVTCGRFDPTVLGAVVAAGYDRSYEDLDGQPASTRTVTALAGPAAGCGGITLDAGTGAITLPPGTGFDPGGIGKGLAADLVAAELVERGAQGACVNLGGDLRVIGEAPTDAGWVIAVEDAVDEHRETARVAIDGGALATTNRLTRTWPGAGRIRHHLIDPATGLPAFHGLSAVTVLTGEAWWAEVLAKAAFLAGPTDAPDLLAAAGATGILVDDTGRATLLAGMEDYLQ